MPKKLTLVILGGTILSVFLALIGGLVLQNMVEQSLAEDLTLERPRHYEYVISGVRTPLLLADFRKVEQDLQSALGGEEVDEIILYDATGKVVHRIDAHNGNSEKAVEQVSVGIWYDESGREPWGTAVFNLHRRNSALQNTLRGLLLLVAGVGLLLFIVFAVTVLLALAKEYRLYRRLAIEIVGAKGGLEEGRRLPLPVFEELRRLAAELERNNHLLRRQTELAAVGRTTAMLAHDLRKPFALFKVALGRVLELNEVGDQQVGQIRQVEAELGHAERMLEDLLAATSERNLILLPEDPVQLVEEALASSVPAGLPTELHLRRELRTTRPVCADRRAVERILLNVIQNAVEASHGQGPVTVRTQDDGEGQGQVLFSVHNHGSYLPPELHERIFEPFYTSGKRGGTGLGLAICRKLAEEHGGTIWVQSEPEEGTTFFVALPAWEGAEDSAKVEPDVPHPREGLVLVVDDDELLRTHTVELVARRWGREKVVSAATPAEARAALEAGGIRLVFTDLELGVPGDNGLDLARWIRLHYPALPVLLVTSADASLGKTELEQGIATAWLRAPLNAETLAGVLPL